jgi:hypothetical protein
MAEPTVLDTLDAMLLDYTRTALERSATDADLRSHVHFVSVQVKYWLHALPPAERDEVTRYLHRQREQMRFPPQLESAAEQEAYRQLITFVLGRSALL